MLDYSLDLNIDVELHKNFERERIISILNKYWKNESAIDEILDQIMTFGEVNEGILEMSIAERVKLRRQKAEILKKN